MKKVEVEKLVSKSIIITAILLCLILGMTFVENRFINALTYPVISKAVVVISIIFAVIAIAMVMLGIFKNSKYYAYATISAVAAILFMLLKIDHDIKGIGFTVGTRTVKFYFIAMAILCLAILVTWVRTTIKLIRE